MLGLLCKRLSQFRWAGDSSTRPWFPQISCPKFFSNAANEHTLTVDYLVNSCGLSPESALNASKRMNLKNTAKADSVLTLFKNYGFTQQQIANIISHNPDVLKSDPDKTLKPKIELLCNMGISGPILAKILSKNADFLSASLERKLIPTLEFLKSFIDTDEKIAVTLSRMSWCSRVPETMAPNIEILRNHGVPDSNISNLIFLHPRLLYSKAERFKEIVMQAKEMGLNPSTYTFITGIRALAGLSRATWEAKIAVFSSFGWLEDEIFSLFRKYPSIFGQSEKRIRERLNFFVNELNWTVADLGRCPTAFQCSMEKRIAPRCSVLRVLLAKGLLKKERMITALQWTDDQFYDKYVLKYLEEQPQLLEIYQREMGIQESEIGSDIVSG
ncbi:hypothetical protein NE237_009523 [Protea cynaroides]|uniref:Uncharacterized protein n=1 Tax=Protea cynaroides TaxID=273540 RepID=A0A9Q0KXL8_9MAGN|nr:hypothetical protein NE237_009523 [Protea cynaroides]